MQKTLQPTLVWLSMILSVAMGSSMSALATDSDDATINNPDQHDERLKLKIYSGDWREDSNMQRAQEIVDGMVERTDNQQQGYNPYQTVDTEADNIPSNYSPWWVNTVTSPLSTSTKAVRETPDSVAMRALAHSAQIKVFSEIPLIRETAEMEIKGRYDIHAYAEGRLTELDDPVGSELTTGGPDRFLEDEWMGKLGFRKKFITGTEVDISQRWGVKENNSEFFVPNEQANTRVAVTVTQPLLNGRGWRYHRNSIDITRIDASVAMDEFHRQVESHLLEVVRAYWGLWLERSALVQRRKLVSETNEMVQRLAQRADYDASNAQVNRARSETHRRISDMVRAESAVRNAEARLVGLVNDPSLRMNRNLEIIPDLAPIAAQTTLDMQSVIALAMENRPEIQQSFKQLRAASIRAKMTRHELSPVLNLVVQYYRDGIAGEGDTSRARDLQSEGDGSWAVGLVFDIPIQNRAARARHTRRQIEIRQLSEQLRTTLETVALEIQVSKREVDTSWRENQAKYAVMQSVKQEVALLKDREGVELSGGARAADYIERLIDAQDRLAAAEYEFLQSQVSYSVSLANMDRATGTFLTTRNIVPERVEDQYDGILLWQMRQLKAAQSN